MPAERWGSLSVDDHVDATALTANVLLYDRVVVPVMTAQVDRDEREYWNTQGWDPNLQSTRLEQLGDLAVPKPWDAGRRRAFADRLALLKEENDAVDPKYVTRVVLAEEQVLRPPPGVFKVDVIAAYNSAAALRKDFVLDEARDHLSAQAFLLTRRLAVPNFPDAEDAFTEAIKLSRDEGFREKRRRLFDWQVAVIGKGYTPAQVVEQIGEWVDEYNKEVTSAFKSVRWKFAFTVGTVTLQLAGGLLALGTGNAAAAGLAAGSAALTLARFATVDGKAVIKADARREVAMFHDAQTQIGVKLMPGPNANARKRAK